MKRQLHSTITRCVPLGLALLLCAAGASAQMFKWTDAKGVVHFSDQPPSGQEARVETKSFAAGGSAALPYELAQAVRNSPVTLFTAPDCSACDQGRALLEQRGIPFAEKTVTTDDDQQKLKEAGGTGQVPLLVVGSNRQVGFAAGAWNEALTDAAYPSQRMLPASYQNPAAVAAAPKPEHPLARDAVREPKAESAPARPKAPPPADTPPGFRF